MTAAGPAAGQDTAAELAARAVAGVLADLAGLDSRGRRGVVVDSPPGITSPSRRPNSSWRRTGTAFAPAASRARR